MTINEENLKASLKCQLIDIKRPEIEYIVSKRLFSWAVNQSFYGKTLTLNSLKVKFEQILLEYVNKQDSNFFNQLKLGIKAVKKIFLFISSHEILKPVEYYKLFAQSIEGEYALVKKRSKVDKTAFVVCLHENRPIYYRYPDIVELLRWYHVISTTSYENVKVYNLSLFWGDSWIHSIKNETKIKDLINLAVKSYNLCAIIPTPGSHCETCVSKKCLELLNE